MTDKEETYLHVEEDCKTRLTAAQKGALNQILELDTVYHGRWFPVCELKRVIAVTLEALVTKGYLLKKDSKVNPNIVYYRYTGKPFESGYLDWISKNVEYKE